VNCYELLILLYIRCAQGILTDFSVYRLKLQNFENVKGPLNRFMGALTRVAKEVKFHFQLLTSA